MDLKITKGKAIIGSNIEIKSIYKGKVVGKDFFDKNPEIFSQFPSQEEVLAEHARLYNLKKNPSDEGLIIVTIDGIQSSINGQHV